MTDLHWGLTGISLIGVVLNIFKDRKCFLFWIFSNAAWAIVDFHAGLFAQAFLFGVYFVLAVWGWFKW